MGQNISKCDSWNFFTYVQTLNPAYIHLKEALQPFSELQIFLTQHRCALTQSVLFHMIIHSKTETFSLWYSQQINNHKCQGFECHHKEGELALTCTRINKHWKQIGHIKNSIFFLFFNWDSLHARLNSHYKAWSYKKKGHKKIKAYRKSLYKEPTVNKCLLILDLKPFRL